MNIDPAAFEAAKQQEDCRICRGADNTRGVEPCEHELVAHALLAAKESLNACALSLERTGADYATEKVRADALAVEVENWQKVHQDCRQIQTQRDLLDEAVAKTLLFHERGMHLLDDACRRALVRSQMQTEA